MYTAYPQIGLLSLCVILYLQLYIYCFFSSYFFSQFIDLCHSCVWQIFCSSVFVYLLWQTAHDRQDHTSMSVMDELTNQIEYGDRRRETTIVSDWKPYLQQYTNIIKTPTLWIYFSYIWSKLKYTRNQMTSDLYVLNWKSSYDVMLLMYQRRQQHFA